MLPALISVAVLLLVCAPVSAELTVSLHGHWQATLCISLYSIALPARTLFPAAKARRSARQSMTELRAWLAAFMAVPVQRHIRLQRFAVSAGLSLPDAARSAQLCGLLNNLPLVLPQAWQRVSSVQVLPDFWSGRSALDASCIISSRLGIIAVDALRLLLNHHRQIRASAAQQ